MTRTTHVLVCSRPLARVLACQEKQGPALPAATGAGAPPAPAIPTLAEVGAKLAGSETAAAASRAIGHRFAARAASKPRSGRRRPARSPRSRSKRAIASRRARCCSASTRRRPSSRSSKPRRRCSSADVQLAAANLEFGRTKALRERGSVPPDVFDQAKARVDAAQQRGRPGQGRGRAGATPRHEHGRAGAVRRRGHRAPHERRRDRHADAAVGRARDPRPRRARAARAACPSRRCRACTRAARSPRAFLRSARRGACASSASARRSTRAAARSRSSPTSTTRTTACCRHAGRGLVRPARRPRAEAGRAPSSSAERVAQEERDATR